MRWRCFCAQNRGYLTLKQPAADGDLHVHPRHKLLQDASPMAPRTPVAVAAAAAPAAARRRAQ